jgi:NhaP-type Na+/H+ or K+/H+ antiporter
VEGHAAFTLVLALAAGVVSQSVARHLRLPGIVVLLLAGVALGPDGLGLVLPRALGGGFFSVVDIAVAVILFEGGMNLQISRLRREQSAIRRLVLSGAILTLGLAAIAVHWILGWTWELSVLFGSLVVVTGPTVVGPLVSELRLRPRVATVLNAEGVLIDPVGAILAVLVLEVVIEPERAASGAAGLLLRVGVGTAFGLVSGLALGMLLRIRRLVPEGHENIFVLAMVLLVFVLADEMATHSGILAVTIAGVTVGNMQTRVDRDLREFKDQLTILLIGLLFVMLAADVRLDDVRALGRPGLAVVGVLVFVVRPLVVAVTTRGSDLSARERLFVGWVAPRGIVAAAVASLVATTLEESGLDGGSELRALVFLTITGTVLQAGLTAGLVARLLDVKLPRREGVAILGAQGLGFLLAEQLRRGGVPVVFLDANPQACRQAEEAGFTVIFGNALEERTLQRAQLHSVETTVGLTPNQTVNAVFVNRAKEFFRVPQSYVAVQALETGMAAELVRNEEAQVAFDGAHDIERWDVRVRHGSVEIATFRFDASRLPEPASGDEPAPQLPPIGERCVMLTLERGSQPMRPMWRSYVPSDGDVVVVALHLPDMEEALAALDARGFVRIEPAPDAEAGDGANAPDEPDAPVG